MGNPSSSGTEKPKTPLDGGVFANGANYKLNFNLYLKSLLRTGIYAWRCQISLLLFFSSTSATSLHRHPVTEAASRLRRGF